MAWNRSPLASNSAWSTGNVTSSLPVSDQAFVGKAVVPVHTTSPAAPSSALAKLAVGPSRRSHSWSSTESGKKLRARALDRTTPLTLNVSLSRSATSLPTFPEAPMTVTVLPGASAAAGVQSASSATRSAAIAKLFSVYEPINPH